MTIAHKCINCRKVFLYTDRLGLCKECFSKVLESDSQVATNDVWLGFSKVKNNWRWIFRDGGTKE